MEQYVNDWGTTLAGSITDSQTSIAVANNASFPATGNFRIRIDSELMIVTAVSGTTWTVTRGAEGTLAATHLNGSAINSFFTAGALDAIRADINQIGPVASLPTVAKTGDQFKPTDSLLTYHYNGSSWDAFYNGTYVTPPTSGTWSDLSQLGSNTLSYSRGYMEVLPTANNNFGFMLATMPSAPYTVTVMFVYCAMPENYSGVGIRLVETGTGKGIDMQLQYGAAPTSPMLVVEKVNSGGSWNSFYKNVGNYSFWNPVFFRLQDTGTNYSWNISTDGLNFAQFGAWSRTDWVSPSNTVKVGPMVNGCPDYKIVAAVLSWSVTQP